MLQAFARNGLQILQWCMLVLLYEAEKMGKKLTQDDIRHQLDLPKSNLPPPKGATKSAGDIPNPISERIGPRRHEKKQRPSKAPL